tara:strand:+ start:648 stop:1760 length:1113 start_codon:yes stop_codon:yes gene_type:complete
MGKLRKIGKKIAGGFRKVGRKLKKGLGKIARAFGKLGPLGSLALSFILPGIGGAISNWLTTGPMASFFQPIFNGISKAGKFLKDGVGRVFNKVTDAIEVGMNTVSKPFMQEGARGAGSAFRDFVSDVTGGFVEKSNVGLKAPDGTLVTDLGKEELSILKDSGDLKNLQDEASFNRFNKPKSILEPGTTPDLAKGEVLNFNEVTGKSEIWDEEKLIASNKGFTPKVPEIVEPKSSVFEKPADADTTLRERIKDSKEYSVYKKIAPVSAFGTSIIQNENDIANYNQSVLEQQSDYFSGYAQSFLNSGTNQQFDGSAQQSFVDVSKFQQSSNLTEDWLKTVYGNINIPTDPTQALLLAQQANPYGFQLTDIYT